MDWRNVAKGNEGLHTAESFSRSAGISRQTAINYIHEMRARGFVETSVGKRRIRLYRISPVRLRRIGFPGLLETINRYSSIKLSPHLIERLDHELKPEEAIVRAIKTREFRVILASAELFRHVRDWWLLYRHAKKEGVEREVGALYSAARRIVKVRSMDNRVMAFFMKARLRRKNMVPGLRSKDFGDIEKEWGVCVPFNKSDFKR